MSGYRLIHREQVLDEDTAVWSLVTTPLLGTTTTKRTTITDLTSAAATTTTVAAAAAWRVWVACSDGCIRSYVAQEVSLSQKEATLTASALSFGQGPTHILEPTTKTKTSSSSSSSSSSITTKTSSSTTTTTTTTTLGCTALSLCRNYTGEDDNAGNIMVAGMDLSGIVRIWELKQGLDDADSDDHGAAHSTQHVSATVEFACPQATGTAMAMASPRSILPHLGVLIVAVAYLDGTVSLVSTGIPVPNATETNNNNKPSSLPEAGTVLESWGSGSALACRLVFRPNVAQIAVARQDGTVDLISVDQSQRLHRLSQLVSAPARAINFTADGHLLIAGNDQGRMVLWDVTRPNGIPAVVNHQVQATLPTSWLWQLASLDERRFISLATDKTIRIWQVDQVHHQPLHSFTSSDDIRLWCISCAALGSTSNPHPPRLVAGSENGWLLVYSLVEKA